MLTSPTWTLDTTTLKKYENIEVYKQKVAISCENVFAVAQNAARKHPELRNVIIMEHAARAYDPRVDPTGIKTELAKYANATFATLAQNEPTNSRITLGKHNLDCPADMANAWYMDDRTGRYDGVHLYGSRGSWAYTMSVLTILQDVIPSSHSSHSSTSHQNCPQEIYARSQKQNQSRKFSHKTHRNIFTQNRFSILGN